MYNEYFFIFEAEEVCWSIGVPTIDINVDLVVEFNMN